MKIEFDGMTVDDRGRLLPAQDPRRVAEALWRSQSGNLSTYRVGDYQVILGAMFETLTAKTFLDPTK